VEARATGLALAGPRARAAALEPGRGRELRFDFRNADAGADSVAFRFAVQGGGDRDAVRVAVPVRPATRPAVTTLAGVVRDSTVTVTLTPDPGADPARSRLSLSVGASPLALLRGLGDELRVYPYLCSEQVSSGALPLIALYRARRAAGAAAGDTARLAAEVERAVTTLSRRQRDDGGIGLWGRGDWTTPWLSGQAGLALLEARAAGVPVRDSVIAGIAGYLRASLEREQDAFLLATAPLRDRDPRLGLAERLTVADFLRRAGQPDVALENELLRRAGQLAPADRLALAQVLARRGDARNARALVEPFWRLARVDGRTASLPDSLRHRTYMGSRLRPLADLLLATLAVDAAHPLLGPLLEAVVARGRPGAAAPGPWHTQDVALAARVADAWQRRLPPDPAGRVTVRMGRRVVLATGAGGADSTIPLAALTGRRAVAVALEVAAEGAGGGPAFFHLTLTETPRAPAVRPEDRGFVVERWYEDPATGRAVLAVTEGDLVRVRLRVTVPDDRAFVVLDDPLPAGLEAIDLGLRTTGLAPGPGAADSAGAEPGPGAGDGDAVPRWAFGRWDAGWWSPFEHREVRDDRVVYAARALWRGTYTATYLARATTPGTFLRPQAHAEEMYNPAVRGRSEGGTFTVRARSP
jgi:alpha-2-macroglobulin